MTHNDETYEVIEVRSVTHNDENENMIEVQSTTENTRYSSLRKKGWVGTQSRQAGPAAEC